MKLLKASLTPIITILITAFALLPLFHPGFYPMHDDEQIARLFDLNNALLAGHIPPRIAPNLGFGYGYPFFNFYPPFAYYVGELFHLLGFTYIVSTKLMIASGFILSALFMYMFVKEFFGKLGGLVSSVAYTYASYHAVDVYVRGAFAEFYAFVFIPLIFWATYKTSQGKQLIYVLIGAFAVAGLILSHNLVAFMSFPFLAVWLLFNLFQKTNKKIIFLRYILLFVLGIGLSSYFFIPSYLERGYTMVNILTTELADYSLHFVCTHQLWDSPWGYGGSIPGCYDGISFELGKIQILISIISILLAGVFLGKKKLRKLLMLTSVMCILLAFSMFLMVKFSKPIWDIIPPLWYVQFPWRFLLIASFFSAVLSGSIFGFIKRDLLKFAIACIFIFLLIFSTVFRFSPIQFFNTTDSAYVNLEKIRWETSNLSYEYVPKGIKTKKSTIGTTLVDINKSEIATTSFKVVTGEMNVMVLNSLPQYKKYQVKVLSSGIFRINTYSFPGWKIFANKNEISYSDKNKFKLIEIILPVGNYTIEAKFTNTRVRTAGNMITLVSIIGLLILTIYSLNRKTI